MARVVEVVVERLVEDDKTKWFMSFPSDGPLFSKSERKRVKVDPATAMQYKRAGTKGREKILRNLWNK